MQGNIYKWKCTKVHKIINYKHSKVKGYSNKRTYTYIYIQDYKTKTVNSCPCKEHYWNATITELSYHCSNEIENCTFSLGNG